ncbi:TonB-dependent receptor domain-containing protein [Phenylobacterium sp.]|uniref:TonB-dependent receptor domain-containing protein n=1 Tax=Phenylobacterium sp. TaxID=1871053 RepID=UPI0035C81DCC
MLKSSYFYGGSAIAVALALGAASPALAQQGSGATVVEEVVVTGSFIAGTPEDAALPVDVLGAQELEKQGAPSVVQLVKTISASQSAIGESNRYNGGAGTATINLRGFGSSRTLVLMNGRRMVDSTQASFQGGGQDLNFIPTAATGRIEILKDGAAATYGSDAVGGVVNFITRKDLDGFEVDGEYTYIDGSDGDYSLDLAWGSIFERGNVLLTAGYRHRSRLDINDRDWARTRMDAVYYGGWSGSGNPGYYGTPGGTTFFRDNGCLELGGQLTAGVTPTTNTATGSVCRFQFSAFNDLVNEEDHYQLYGEVNFDVTDTVTFHGEVAWNRNDVPNQRLSPANLTTQFPTPISAGGTSGSTAVPGFNGQVPFFVPANNPGLIDLRTTCAAPLTPGQCALMAGGVTMNKSFWRAIAHAGHPTNPDGADYQDIQSNAFRISGGFKGEFENGIGWDAALTYMESEATVVTNDLLVNNIQNALRGLGGPGCNPATGTPGVGPCQFFNPFTNSIAVSAVNGATNPYYRGDANPAVLNNPALVEWLYGTYTNVGTNKMLVADLVFNGETGIALGGGNIAWAAGAQYRYNRSIDDWENLGDVRATPCVDSIDDGLPVCSDPVGPFVFFGAQEDYDVDRDVEALFAEVLLPITDDLEVTGAIRYENFGGNIGSTTNPKISARWQAMDWLAFRASAGSTFRAPSQVVIAPGSSKGVSNIGGSYRAVVTNNNPDLEPETAKTFNFGVLLDFGAFRGSIDYFKFDFEDELTLEPSQAIYNSLDCSNPAIVARFVFDGACSANNVIVLNRYNVNGPDTKTSGLDFKAQYDFDNFFGRDFMDTRVSVGAEGTYLLEYERSDFTLLGAETVVIQEAQDRVGRHELTGEFYSYPRLRANGFINVDGGAWNLRYQIQYREGTEIIGDPCPASGASAACRYDYATSTFVNVGKSEDYWQHDLNLRVDLPSNTVITASVQNVLDEDPPFVQSMYNYDYTNGNPLGRTFKIGVKQTF